MATKIDTTIVTRGTHTYVRTTDPQTDGQTAN